MISAIIPAYNEAPLQSPLIIFRCSRFQNALKSRADGELLGLRDGVANPFSLTKVYPS